MPDNQPNSIPPDNQVKEKGEASLGASADSFPYQYSCTAYITGLAVATLVRIDFDGSSVYFKGEGGGLGVGGGAFRGKANFNYSLDTLSDWKVRFELAAIPGGANINLWGMHDEYVGEFLGGGIVVDGVFGGKGGFHIKKSDTESPVEVSDPPK